MKRFLLLAFALWASLLIWSSSASAATFWYNSSASASAACESGVAGRGPYWHCVDTGSSWVLRAGNTSVNHYNYVTSCSSAFGSGAYTDPETGQCSAEPPPPVCESPNYVDVVSGECLAPQEQCFTNLDNGDNECVYIEPDSEGYGCVAFQGKEICVTTEEPECYTIDNTKTCKEEAEVCGIKNGVHHCINPQEEGCGFYMGSRVCLDPEGTPVAETSPDHPSNGGNLDGDDTNDPTDPRDPTTEGGDPDNQPNQPIETLDADRASEQTSRDNLEQSKKIADNTKSAANSLKQIAETGIKTDLSEEVSQGELDGIIQNGASGSWDDPATGTWADVDAFQDGIGDGSTDYSTGMLDGIGNTATGLIDQGSCTALGFVFKGNSFALGCDKTQVIRDLLSWVLYIMTVWCLFEIVTAPTVRQK